MLYASCSVNLPAQVDLCLERDPALDSNLSISISSKVGEKGTLTRRSALQYTLARLVTSYTIYPLIPPILVAILLHQVLHRAHIPLLILLDRREHSQGNLESKVCGCNESCRHIETHVHFVEPKRGLHV